MRAKTTVRVYYTASGDDHEWRYIQEFVMPEPPTEVVIEKFLTVPDINNYVAYAVEVTTQWETDAQLAAAGNAR